METSTVTQSQKYEIAKAEFERSGYVVFVDGDYLRNKYGIARLFTTRASARKAITRHRRPDGDRHR